MVRHRLAVDFGGEQLADEIVARVRPAVGDLGQEEREELVTRLRAQYGVLKSELEHAPHPCRELIGHRFVDAEDLSDDPHRDLLGIALRPVGLARIYEPVDQRAAQLTRVRLVLGDRLR